jgi:DUF1680 family protein
MKTYRFDKVELTSGYLFDKQELNRIRTIYAVYDRFDETGRIGAFDFDYVPAEDKKPPHVFWDSDVAKWMEGAAYIIKKHPSPDLEERIDALVEKIKEHQDENGYFNIHFTVAAPNDRFKDRDKHELYCAGHLMEAAIAYDEATGKRDFLDCMEKYADHINRVFIEEKSAEFQTPGHQEIEIALVRMYLHTGKQKYLDMAKHFIDTRGSSETSEPNVSYNQSHLPVREQTEAVGHSVRAMYLYTGMALLAAQTGDESLVKACKKLWDDVTLKKMYVTGGIGSTYVGEAFTNPYDLPNEGAYTETCAGIGLVFFANAMLALENDSKYADVIERVIYNGLLSGLSLDGASFFYENPLEINLIEHFQNERGKKRLPPTQRVECFSCSCCPPNINRFLPSIGNYLYAIDGDVLFINQFVSSKLEDGGVTCRVTTDYPISGKIKIEVDGVSKIAVRIPEWCEKYEIDRDFAIQNGYAVMRSDGGAINITFDMTPRAVFADPRVIRDCSRLCIMRGPVVYCAEGIDNDENLHAYSVPYSPECREDANEEFGLPTLEVSATRLLPFESTLYSSRRPEKVKATLKMIPYNCFANRGQTNMIVWIHAE